MKKKAMALALSLALTVGLCPGMAFAATDSSVVELAAGKAATALDVQASGNLAKGKTFKFKGSTYKVTKACKVSGDDVTEGTAELVKYGGAAKQIPALGYPDDVWDPTLSSGYSYRVTSIGSSAFNTTQGKKVTNLELGVYVAKIGKNAFKNMTSLKELDLSLMFANNSYSVSKVAKKIGSGAFKGTGKSKGKSLTVYCGYAKSKKSLKSAKNKKYLASCKKQLVKKGLSSSSSVDMIVL